MRSGRFYRHALGFTLIELLMVVGIMGVLASIVILAINPTKQISDAKDAQRLAHLNAILNSVRQFEVATGRLPRLNGVEAVLIQSNPASKEICRHDASSFAYGFCHSYQFRYLGELVPDYLAKIPVDPDHDPVDTWGTDYSIWKDADGRITVCSSLYTNGGCTGSERKL